VLGNRNSLFRRRRFKARPAAPGCGWAGDPYGR